MQAGSAVPFMTRLGDDSCHNFAKLAGEFLDHARAGYEKYPNSHHWPIYSSAFQAVENYLKAYLLARGETVDNLKDRIRHKIRTAFTEATNKGLMLDVPSHVIEEVLKVSHYYTNSDFRYKNLGSWYLVSVGVVIEFADAVRKAAGFYP